MREISKTPVKVVKVAIVALCAHSASSDKPSIASGAVVLEEKDVGTDASKAVSRKASETPASGTLTDNGDSTGNGTEERGLLHLLLKKGSGYGHGYEAGGGGISVNLGLSAGGYKEGGYSSGGGHGYGHGGG
ncbi:glycine-rich protein HC1-like [Varroa jacobsoni]|uniref:glycine-rich protein HC1-like n=1 Tax=Varroa jacobsoni TaxID=62625 RepID=UPI000BF9FF27|nr:glycine-rich protein HC1-like [Varroa jacobsoni]